MPRESKHGMRDSIMLPSIILNMEKHYMIGYYREDEGTSDKSIKMAKLGMNTSIMIPEKTQTQKC